MLRHVADRPVNEHEHKVYTNLVKDVAYNKYFVPEFAEETPDVPVLEAVEEDWEAREARNAAAREAARWKLEKSIWKPRKKWAESGDYHDTDTLIRKCMEHDWKICLGNHNTAGFIAKLDGSPGCLEACFDVLWENVSLVYGIFDYYATLGSADDIFHIQYNGYKSILDDCDVYISGSKTCNLTAFDQLFIAVNAGSEGKHSLQRSEWVETLVRVAALRYVSTGEITSFPAALSHLISSTLMPKVDREALQDTRAFRDANCYTQDVDNILQSFKVSLQSIFKQYAKGTGAIGNDMDSVKLLSYVEWKRLVKDLRLLDVDFTSREQDLAFTWSRMRIVNDENVESKKKIHQISFEDFLEVIVRCSIFKTLPTDEQIYAAGFEDAGDFILTLRDDQPADYAEWLSRNARDWQTPPNQAAFRLVEHMCSLITRTILQKITDTEDSSKAFADAENLTVENIELFQKVCLRPLSKKN